MPQASRKYGNILSPFHRFDKFILHPKFEIFNTQYPAKVRKTPAFFAAQPPFAVSDCDYRLLFVDY